MQFEFDCSIGKSLCNTSSFEVPVKICPSFTLNSVLAQVYVVRVCLEFRLMFMQFEFDCSIGKSLSNTSSFEVPVKICPSFNLISVSALVYLVRICLKLRLMYMHFEFVTSIGKSLSNTS